MSPPIASRVGAALMDACVCGLLASKTRVLVTHQLQARLNVAEGGQLLLHLRTPPHPALPPLQHLDRADSIVVMEAGRVVAEGQLAALAALAASAVAADGAATDTVAADAAAAAAAVAIGPSRPSSSDHAPGRLVAEMLAALKAGTAAPPVDEIDTGATPLPSTPPSEPSSVAGQAESSSGSGIPETATQPAAAAVAAADAKATGGGHVAAEGMATGTVGSSVLLAYAKVRANDPTWLPSIPKCTQLLSPAGCRRRADGGVPRRPLLGGHVADRHVVRHPGAMERPATGTAIRRVLPRPIRGCVCAPRPTFPPAHHRTLAAGLVVAASIVCWWRAVAFFERCVAAAASLHDTAFFRVLRAPLAFFDSNPTGRILNRFSKELALVDEVRRGASGEGRGGRCE